MRREVIAILRGAARRLLLTRSAESAGAAGTVGGLAAAAVVTGLAFAQSRPALAVLICALPVAAGLALTASRGFARALALDRPCAIWAGLVSLAAGGGGAAAIITGGHAHLPRLLAAVGPLGVAVTGGALIRLVRGVSLQEAAEFMDDRAGLDERLATAVCLAGSPAEAGPLADAVFSQALAALRDRRPQRAPMWRRSRAAAAALALAVLLCAAVAFLPGPGAGAPGAIELARALNDMSPAQRNRVVEALRRAARSGDPRLADRLRRAARVVQANDAEEVARAIRRLRREGFRFVSVIPRELLVAAGLGPGAGGDGGRAAGRNGAAARAAGRRHAATRRAADAAAPARRVLVFHPGYRGAATGAVAETGPWLQAALVPYASAWSEARDRAARALARGKVPPRYRRIVRAFFLDRQ